MQADQTLLKDLEISNTPVCPHVGFARRSWALEPGDPDPKARMLSPHRTGEKGKNRWRERGIGQEPGKANSCGEHLPTPFFTCSQLIPAPGNALHHRAELSSLHLRSRKLREVRAAAERAFCQCRCVGALIER